MKNQIRQQKIWRYGHFNSVRLNVQRLFHVAHVVQNRQSAPSLVWREWFLCKGRKWMIYFLGFALSSKPRRPADVKISHKKACRTCSIIIFSHSTNHIFDLWRCRCRSSFLNYLMFRTRRQTKYVKMKKLTCRACSMRWNFFGLFANYANIWSHLCRRPSSLRKLAILFWRRQH